MILSRKYKEELNKIVMSEEMKKRILHNVLNENIEPKSAVSGVKKYSLPKRNMQIIAACFTVVVCLSVVKSYPQLLKHENVNLQQKEIDASSDDENSSISKSSESSKTNEDNIDNKNEDINIVDNKNDNISNDSMTRKSQAINQYSGNDENSKINESVSNNETTNKSEDENPTKMEQQETNSVKPTANSNEVSSKTTKLPSDANNENKEAISPDKILKDTIKDQDETAKKKVGDDNKADSAQMTIAGYSIKEYKNLEDAESSADFKISPIKVMPQGFNIDNISVESNQIIQIEYSSEHDMINFRAGKEVDDVSGDYNNYQFDNTVNINGISVSLKGNKNNEVNVATWKKDNIAYSISDVNGGDKDMILNMVKSSLK